MEEVMHLFRGKLNKLQLRSNNECYGPCPEPNDEVEQHLTIVDDGRVWFSRYCYDENYRQKLQEKRAFKVSAEAAKGILIRVAKYFSQTHVMEYITDVGSWDAVLTNTEGTVFKFGGPLVHDLEYEGCGLSRLIRENLRISDLYAFDGNPDYNDFL